MAYLLLELSATNQPLGGARVSPTKTTYYVCTALATTRNTYCPKCAKNVIGVKFLLSASEVELDQKERKEERNISRSASYNGRCRQREPSGVSVDTVSSKVTQATGASNVGHAYADLPLTSTENSIVACAVLLGFPTIW